MPFGEFYCHVRVTPRLVRIKEPNSVNLIRAAGFWYAVIVTANRVVYHQEFMLSRLSGKLMRDFFFFYS